MKISAIVAMLGLLVVLSACASNYEPGAVGIGQDPAQMKLSPCACLKIETKPGLPEWLGQQKS